MKTALRYLLRGGLALGLLVVLAICGAFGYRAYRQFDNARFLTIDTANAVLESGYVEIGGVRQWVQIRGENRDNVVLLLVAGGPGWSSINQVYREARSWERYFSVVQWDQRGAGRTRLLEEEPPGQPIDRYVQDGIAVAEYALSRLGDRKIILMGWSWGSLVGTEMARARPDLFSAYVGTGQIVNMQANEVVGYERLLERVEENGDARALARLRQIGPPPYADMDTFAAARVVLYLHPPPGERNLISRLLLAAAYAPGYGMLETYDIAMASMNVDPALIDEFIAYDATSRGLAFSIPMFYFLGAEDIQTPTELVRPYFDQLSAPRKDLVVFPAAGHWVPIFESERFLGELRARVLPAVDATRP